MTAVVVAVADESSAAMDFRHGLQDVCVNTHGRVLQVLAHADEPLTRRPIAHRVGLSSHGVQRALEGLAGAGIVWRAKVTPYWHWHVLYREHVAVEAILALANLHVTLGERVAAHAADWQPPPATLALRLPCPAGADAESRELTDLLVVRPPLADTHRPGWAAQVDTLVEALRHWSGNHTHSTVLDEAEAAAEEV
jgi:hypothetical protein